MPYYFEEMKKCSKEEKLKALKHIDVILSLSTCAHKRGLFALEALMIGTDSKFLLKAIELVVDGVNPETVKSILMNYMKTTELEPWEILERSIYLEGVLLIQNGKYPWEIREVLISLLGESVVTEVSDYYESKIDMDEIEDSFIEGENLASKECKLEKDINSMNPRQLQRILRECDLLVLVVASCGLNQKNRMRILACLSSRIEHNFMELYDLLENINLPQVVDAQNSIIEIIQGLRLSKDI